MDRCGVDSKVKKTLVRNCEQKVQPPRRKTVAYTPTANSTRQTKSASETFKKSQSQIRESQKENHLGQPSLCSTETIANYLCEVANNRPPLSTEGGNLNKQPTPMSSKITKKLNFHLNDRMFKDLVELNTSESDLKSIKKDKRPVTNSMKRDLEPNIEDFYPDDTEIDSLPNIPTMKLKFKPIIKISYGKIHKLVASYEDL